MPQRHRLSNLISGLSSSAKSSRRRHKFNRRYSFEVLENRIVLANEIFTYLNSSVFPTSAVVGFSNPLTLAADFDGNQRDDLLLVDRMSGFNRVVLNGSNGQFSSFDDYFSRSALTNLGDNHSLVSGRFHIDSPFESLLVVNRQTGHNRFYWVDGGSFNERINIFPAGMIGSLVSGASIVGGNFDGIGLDDVLVLDVSSGNNRALLNSTSVPPTLQNGFLDPEWNLGFQSSSVFAADFDGNRFADVLLVNSTSGANRLIYNQPYSTDRFINRDAELSSKTIGSLGQNYTPLAGDFDGNYLGDVVFLNRSNGHNSVFSGTIAPLSQHDDRLWSSVPVQNGSFESPSLVDGGVTAGSVNGWIIEPPTSSPAFAGIFNPNSTYHTNGTVSNGQNAVAIYNATISQSIGHTLLPNREYRLSVDIGNQLPYSTAPWRIELRSGNVVIAWADDRFISPPSGQFETAVASFVSPSNIQPELLSIRIIGGAGWVSFDNVILTQTSVINDLPVQNASFENPALADGAVTSGSVSGWVIEPPTASPAFAGIFNPSPSYHNNGKAADRLNAVTLYNASIYQANSHSLLPNREYTLRVDVGHQIPYNMAPWRIELLGGNTVLSWADQRMLTPATGSFETVVIKYVTPGDVTPMPLAIRIAGGAGWVSFDNVRLTSFSSFSGIPIGNDDNHYWTPAETVLSIPSTSSTTLTTNDYTHQPDAVTATLSVVPNNGTILNFHENGTFVYKPNAGFVGIDTFQYVASSEGRISQPITVSIGVGTAVLPRENKDAIPMSSIMGSSGFGNGFSNIPISSSAETDGVLAKTGGLLLSEDLLPGLSLVYRSDSLTRPIIEVESQFAPTSLPSTITVTSQIGNLASVTHEYSTSGFLSGDKFRLAIQHDASSLATGVYPYTVIIDDNGALAAQTLNGFIRVVNRAGSAFGDGWMLAGLDRIFSTDSGVLLVSGIGNTLWFPQDR